MRYFLRLAYNGACFHGWQSQPNAISVQAVIEEAMSKILRSEISVTGAGRTDTGVNAREMFAHFDFNDEILDKNRFLISLNSMVGRDIVVGDVFPVAEGAHARFDASERTYKYFINFHKSPFLNQFYWRSHSFLDIEKMNEAASMLLKEKDFTSFAKLHSDTKTNICDVRVAEWRFINEDKEAIEFLGNLNNGIVFTISADRFLRNMVRAIVGTLVEVGRNKISLSRFNEIIHEKNRNVAGASMPPYPLFLWKISYPYL